MPANGRRDLIRRLKVNNSYQLNMFRTLILPIFMTTRLCLQRLATSWVHYTTSCNTQSSDPEDGRNHRPKHFELIGIINKPLILHLVGCLYYLCPIIYFRNFVTSVFLMFGCSKIHPVQFDWSVSSVLLLLKLVSYESK